MKKCKSKALNIKKLNRINEDYCRKIIRENITVLRRGKNGQFRDFPAVVVACWGKGIYEKGYSCEPRKNFYKGIILKALKKLGNIGEKNKKINCDNPIGQCAEPHAAQYLNKRRQVAPDDIYFSCAIRPSTGEIIAPCGNCKAVFIKL